MFTPDEVAGVVDLFGALSRPELETALSELAYRRGAEPPESDVDAALAAFALVGVDRGDGRLLVPGPTAFPELPDGAEDLPHILETDGRTLDREPAAAAALARFREAAVQAARCEDEARAAELVDVSYDLEAWGAHDLSGLRARLDAVGEGTNY
ncbi:uncharacterized protein Nmlp_3878 [Natronomonas moolapensis 8.8.11]|uniref:Uncharacterized protein n=2 Tax=Natronomonas moolapensis TaxID=416273 RepID=M1Y5Z6_NATM8|nr:uncharacterized protein Nmlp_3878 [Natronomonas moolapensis 8.8.11]